MRFKRRISVIIWWADLDYLSRHAMETLTAAEMPEMSTPATLIALRRKRADFGALGNPLDITHPFDFAPHSLQRKWDPAQIPAICSGLHTPSAGDPPKSIQVVAWRHFSAVPGISRCSRHSGKDQGGNQTLLSFLPAIARHPSLRVRNSTSERVPGLVSSSMLRLIFTTQTCNYRDNVERLRICRLSRWKVNPERDIPRHALAGRDRLEAGCRDQRC